MISVLMFCGGCLSTLLACIFIDGMKSNLKDRARLYSRVRSLKDG